MIDSILLLAATTFRFLAGTFKKDGMNKLASELEAMALKTDAFRSDPVFKSEMDKLQHSHTWGGDAPPVDPGT